MTHTDDSTGSGLSGAGRYLAVATELPCMVLVFLFVGQTIGQTAAGLQGAMLGGIVGAIIGLFFGIYSVYLTLTRIEKMEVRAQYRRTYTPPLSEILEEPEFPRREDTDKSS